MKSNNKGFTLVELLAVIVIMGILMMVAIPSVSRTIENSRKETFVDIAKSYGNAARNLWTTDNLTCNGTLSSAVDDGDYYILINSKEGAKDALPTLVDQGGKSSWGNRDVNGYVRVNVSTTPGVDSNNDGTYEVEPRRETKFYVALSDGTHGVIDDDTLEMDALKRGNVVMSLSEEQLKKVELTVDDGRLDCGIDVNGNYSCADIRLVKDITEICVDDQTNVGLTGNLAAIEPNLSLNLSANTSNSKIIITGKLENYDDFVNRYTISSHGIVYIKTSQIGTRTLTLNTSGRTKVNFSTFGEDGSFVYNLSPSVKSTQYTFRAYIKYIDDDGSEKTEYSQMERKSYNNLL